MKEPKVEVGILFEPQIEKSVANKSSPITKEESFGTAGNMMNCCLNLWKKLPPLNCWT